MKLAKFFADKFGFAKTKKSEKNEIKVKSTVYPCKFNEVDKSKNVSYPEGAVAYEYKNPILTETNINAIVEPKKPTTMTKTITKKTSKHKLVKQHLIINGSITSWDAIEKYGATRLSAIIYDLRHKEKMNITSERKDFTDRYNNTSSFATYKYSVK